MINESVQTVANNILAEASLNRVLRHLTGQDVKPDLKIGKDANWAILTSSRKFHNPSTDPTVAAKDKELGGGASTPRATAGANRENFNALINAIRAAGFGAIRLSGVWEEKGKVTTHKNDPFERSILIPGRPKALSLAFVQSLGVKYNQDGIIYAGPDSEKPGEAALYKLNKERTAYEFDFSLGKVGVRTPQQIEQALAEVRRGERDFFPASVPGGSGVKANFEPDKGQKADRKVGFAFEAVYERLGVPPCSLVVGSLELDDEKPSQRTRWCDVLDDSPVSYGKPVA